VDGVSFFAREPDDFNFVGEVFLHNTYNVMLRDDCCVIDIGMNIALVSLLLRPKPSVKECPRSSRSSRRQPRPPRTSHSTLLSPPRSPPIMPAIRSRRGRDLMVADPTRRDRCRSTRCRAGTVRIKVRNAATALGRFSPMPASAG
jgi:hypothetical protein